MKMVDNLKCVVEDIKQRFDGLQLQRAFVFTLYFGDDLLGKDVGFDVQLRPTKRTPEGNRLSPLFCARKDPTSKGCFVVGGYISPTKSAWEDRDPPHVSRQKKRKLEQWMKGTGANRGILIGKTRLNDDFVRFYKLTEDGHLEMEFSVPHTKTMPITHTNIRKMCEFLGVTLE